MFGYVHHYLVRYLASNDQSSLSGSLPSNDLGSVPRSLPSPSPHSRPGSFPNPSAENFATNLPSFLRNNEEGSRARRSPCPGRSHGQDSLRLRMPCSTPVDAPSSIAGHDASILVTSSPHSNWPGVANQGRKEMSGTGLVLSRSAVAAQPLSDTRGPCLTRRRGCLYSSRMGRAGDPGALLSFRRNIPVCSESGLPVSNPVF